ncbi:hypothetical protein LCGC14_1404330, partial [marine sediment metagenome]
IIGYYKAGFEFYYERFNVIHPILYEILSKSSIPEAQEFVFALRIPIFIIIIDICQGNKSDLKFFLNTIRLTLVNPIIQHLSRKPIHIFEDTIEKVFYRIRIFQDREDGWKINLSKLAEQVSPYIEKIKNFLI